MKPNTTEINSEHDLALLAKPDLERVCLSCLLVKPELMMEIDGILSEDDFSNLTNKILFGLLHKIFEVCLQQKQPIVFDLIALLDHIKIRGVQDELLSGPGAPQFLQQLKESVGSGLAADVKKFEYYVEQLKDATAKRRLYYNALVIKQDVMKDRSKPADELIVEAEKKILDTHLSIKSLHRQPIQVAQGALAMLKEVWEKPRDFVGIPTGYPMLDQRMGGLRNGEVYVFTAIRKGGKTAFLGNIGLNVSLQGIPVFMISTEMGDQSIQVRLLSRLSDVEIYKIETGRCSEEEKMKIQQAAEDLAQLPFDHLQILDFTPERIISLFRKFVYHKVGFDESGKTKPCLCIFDYVKMPSEVDYKYAWADKEHQLLGIMLDKLKTAASDLGVPILTASQINRQGDIAASQRIEWFAAAQLHWTCRADELSPEQLQTVDPMTYQGVFRLTIPFARWGGQTKEGIAYRWIQSKMQIEEDPTITFQQAL